MRSSSPLTPQSLSLGRRVRGLRALAVVAGGIGAALASGQPTDIAVWDLILRFVFGASITLIGSRAHPAALFASALAGTLLAWPSPWLVAGLASAFLVGNWLPWGRTTRAGERTDIVLSAIAAALAVQVLLRMNERLFFGFDSIVVALAALALMTTAWLRSSDQGRRFSLLGAVALSGVLLIVVVGAVASLPSGRDAAADGVYAAERGLGAARDGETEEAQRYLGLADQSFAIANSRFDAPWARPARLIPVLSQHMRALDIASEKGSELTSVGLELARTIDPTTLMSSDGGLDIAQLSDAAPRLDDAVELLATAQTELARVASPWLLPALSSRLDRAAVDLADSSEQATLVASAASAGPLMLGAGEPQQYLVIFGSPSEARELGGILSNWTLIEVEDGSIERLASGRWQDLQAEAARLGGLDDADGYPRFFTDFDPVATPSNLTALPSIADVARAAVDVFPTLFAETIDGVIYVDPAGLASLLEIVGPISPERTTLRLEPDTIVDYLLRGQYEQFPDLTERHRVLDNLITQVFSSLGSVPLPGPARLGEIFGPAGRGKRLQMVTFDEDVNDFLRSIDLLQDFENPDPTDFLSVTTSNLAPNKLDAWVQRTIGYEMDLDAVSGEMAATVRITLRSEATTDLAPIVLGPATEGFDPGDHRTDVIVWTPHQLAGATIDGRIVETRSSDHYSLNRYAVPVTVPAGETRVVELSLVGRLTNPAEYELSLAHYPGATIDAIELVLERSDGSSETRSFPSTEDVTVVLPLLTARAPS